MHGVILATLAALLAAWGCSGADTGWPAYNKTLHGQRFSALAQITTANVSGLAPVCELIIGEDGAFQTGPVAVGDTMFLTTPHTTVAMHAATCQVFWRHIDTSGKYDPTSVNRGVAYLGGRLFRGLPGSRLAALQASSGRVVWEVPVGDFSAGEFLSSAPIAWDGMVYIGLAGGDWGIRGRIMGYDAATGREVWRFNTIPMGSERGAETWHISGTAERGGGGTWSSYALDPAAGELFVSVGNPAPDFDPDARLGDNLFTNSVVVLDAKSGNLKWWFQATANDGFDWDLAAAPMLYRTGDGDDRVALGSKNGYVYSVSRATHKAVFKTPITTIFNADQRPTREGVRACPGALGGVEWNGPAFDPTTRTIYVGSVDWCMTFKTGGYEYARGQWYFGTQMIYEPTDSAVGWVYALDGTGGRVRWRFRTPKPVVAGVTPTAGGLLFTGDLAGNFYALDKRSGKALLTIPTGGAIAGGVVTYLVGGKQYVATTSGNTSRGTFRNMAGGTAKLIVMALEAPPRGPRRVRLAPVNAGGLVSKQVEEGKQLFERYCAGCHGAQGEGGSGPSLIASSAPHEMAAILAFIKNPRQLMPDLYPDPLNDRQVSVTAMYVRTLQRWKH